MGLDGATYGDRPLSRHLQPFATPPYKRLFGAAVTAYLDSPLSGNTAYRTGMGAWMTVVRNGVKQRGHSKRVRLEDIVRSG